MMITITMIKFNEAEDDGGWCIVLSLTFLGRPIFLPIEIIYWFHLLEKFTDGVRRHIPILQMRSILGLGIGHIAMFLLFVQFLHVMVALKWRHSAMANGHELVVVHGHLVLAPQDCQRTHNWRAAVFCTVNRRTPFASGVTYVFVTHVTKIATNSPQCPTLLLSVLEEASKGKMCCLTLEL